MNIKEQTLWVAHSLFQKGLVTGSTGNISYREGNIIYISQSGSCFGLLDEYSFSEISIDGKIIYGKPSKEWPMHIKIYQVNSNINAVIHTHSLYATIISCLSDLSSEKAKMLFEYTPYLEMQTNGDIGVVEFAKPGSEELFKKFYEVVNKDRTCYILKNHGVFTAGNDMIKAFCVLEEVEQSCKIYSKISSNGIYHKIKV